MKKFAVISMILALGLPLFAAGADAASVGADQVVVDRSTRDKCLNDYALLTRDIIQRSWQTPLDLSSSNAVKGRIRINYTIGRNGDLKGVDLVMGSGNPQLDRSLIDAIRSAAPYPQFPDEIGSRAMLIRANFIVADTPTVPVTTVEHRVDRAASVQADNPADQSDASKKPIWGVPAGTAMSKESESDTRIPARPPLKKYRWGL